MAGIDIITAARDELEETLLDLRLLVETGEAAAGDDHAPAWLASFGRHVGRVLDAAAGYMGAVHQHAHPVLSDLARATAGGMGAVAPMAAKRSGAEASGVRTPDQPMGANANKGRIETGGGGLNGSNSRK